MSACGAAAAAAEAQSRQVLTPEGQKMPWPAAKPQTSAGACGYVVGAMLVFGIGTGVFHPHSSDPYRLPQWLLTGLWFATVNVATDYHRLPMDQRLPPLTAIALGVFNLGFTTWMVQHARQPPIPLDAVAWLLLSVMATPSIYLIAASIRRYQGRDGRGRIGESGT